MLRALDLFGAEWRKLWGNRRVSGCALVVWPVMALGASLGLLLLNVLEARLRTVQLLSWTDVALSVWDVQSNLIGRVAVLAVAATLFAGEYQWRTWKNIVPRRPRVQLMAAKFAVLGFAILLTFIVMSVVMTVGFGVVNLVVGAPYGPDPTLNVIGDFLTRYSIRAGLSFVDTILIGAVVALLAMRARSVLAGAFFGLVVLLIDEALILILGTLSLLFNNESWLELLRLRFTYNLSNLSAILQGGGPLAPVPFPVTMNASGTGFTPPRWRPTRWRSRR
ncbi:MAG: ABC transporter permease [Anaerolineae bacterium]|nr:ABC transporter permease [Anaerolineae bacterium]